jgi:putative MFS transporter
VAGLVYSMSRVSATFSGFIVAYVLRETGAIGVFGIVTAAMVVVVIVMAAFAPNVRGKPRDA